MSILSDTMRYKVSPIFRWWGRMLCVAILSLAGFTLLSVIARTRLDCSSANSRFGVNEVLGWPGLYPPERLERALDMMADAGIGWVRVNWAWKDVQPKNGPFD